MNIRNLALSAITLAILAPSALAASTPNTHACIFQAASDRDGSWCSPFASNDVRMEQHGLKVSTAGQGSFEDVIESDTRGSSMKR